MREIKFRAWDGVQKKMIVPGAYFKLRAGELLRSHFTFLQSTGLKDVKGKEIFERDIVRSYPNDPDMLSHLGVVEYDNKTASFIYKQVHLGEKTNREFWFNPDTSSYEVIGNIYENPQLIS